MAYSTIIMNQIKSLLISPHSRCYCCCFKTGSWFTGCCRASHILSEAMAVFSFVNMKPSSRLEQERRKPQMSPGKTFSLGLNKVMFKKIFNFFKRRIMVYFLFLSDGGAPKSRRAGKTSLLPSPLDEPGLENRTLARCQSGSVQYFVSSQCGF